MSDNSGQSPSPTITDANGVIFGLKKFVTLTCNLATDKDAVIDIPGGMRLKVAYTSLSSSVVLDPSQFGSYKKSGQIKSGGDWVLVRSDGVVFVDARVTIAFGDPKAGPVALVGATLKGTMDLCKTFGIDDGAAAFDAFKSGTSVPTLKVKDKSCHYITGSLRFEVGDVATWTYQNANIMETANQMVNLKPLIRQQFFVLGTVTINQVPNYDPVQIVIEAWGI